MARREREIRATLRPSILDRLLDDDPRTTHEPPLSLPEASRIIMAAVRRDLEWLLNTRTTWIDDVRTAMEYTSRSIAVYGLPDFSHENMKNADARLRFKRRIEHALEVFETRLHRVVVTPGEVGESERRFSFRIEAVLQVDPVREQVTFDAEVESNGVAKIREAF